MLNNIVQIIAFVFLLGGSAFFGYEGKPTEMGLMIAASALAIAFTNIDKIRKFKGAGFEAEMREKVEAIIAKEAEPPDAEERGFLKAKAFGLDENTRLVVRALGNSKYTWRSITGIASESGLPSSIVKTSMNWLNENGLVVSAGISHQSNWGLSELGRELFNSLNASRNAP